MIPPPFDYDGYKRLLKQFEILIPVAITVSALSGGIKTSARYLVGTQIYTRVVLSAMTINRILPDNSVNHESLWDFSSFAILARALMETYHAYYYIAVETLKDPEIDFRLIVFRYHRNLELYRIQKDWRPSHEGLKDLERNLLPGHRTMISEHEIFKTLSKERQNIILGRTMPMYLTHSEIAKRLPFLAGLDRGFEVMYRLLSNHVHNAPFAFLGISNERGRGDRNEAEVFYTTFVLEWVNKYLSSAIVDQATIFPKEILERIPDMVALARTILEEKT